MITTDTTFVLGAGASIPYGFPSGADLLRLVVQSLSRPPQPSVSFVTYTRLRELGHSEEEIETFQRALVHSGRSSVDAFLEHRTEFLEIGKRAIADVLIQYENIDRLFSLDLKDSWYKYLFEQMNAPLGEFGVNTVRFVTFNYDRSLEAYLEEAIANAYGRSREEAAEQLQAIEVLHLHGQLGFLPTQGLPPEFTRPYRDDRTTEATDIAARQIRVMHEDIDASTDEHFIKTRCMMREALRVFFLGFGFHPENLDRLAVAGLDKGNPGLSGTRLGLTDTEARLISTKTEERIQHHALKDCEIIPFFREYYPL